MPQLLGFQTIVIIDLNGMTFDAVCVFGPDFQLLFKCCRNYLRVETIQGQNLFAEKQYMTTFMNLLLRPLSFLKIR